MRKYYTRDGTTYHSFLNAISQESISKDDINHSAIVQFLTFGALYFDETFIKGLNKKFIHQKFSLDPEKGFVEADINSDNPLVEYNGGDAEGEFLDFFEKRINHLYNRRISVDLTGGIDSRLIATVLKHYGVQFEAVFSLDSGNHHEALISKKVADTLNVKLHVLESDVVDSKESLEELFLLSDGLWDVMGLKSLRNIQSWRKRYGYDLVITGVGGELYKDFWWQQDFPFYHKKKTNLQKLIHTRMYPVIINPEWLTEKLKSAANNFFNDFESRLREYQQRNNTQTYDQLYYNVRIKEQISLFTKATLNYLDTYSPLLENELVRIGYNLPRSCRFFNSFHRRIITKLNPKVAKIPTTEGGMSVSNKWQNIVKDYGNYGFYKSAKVAKKLYHRDSDSSKRSVSKGVERKTSEAFETLKDAEVFTSKIEPQNLPQTLSGRILTLGMVMDKL